MSVCNMSICFQKKSAAIEELRPNFKDGSTIIFFAGKYSWLFALNNNKTLNILFYEKVLLFL